VDQDDGEAEELVRLEAVRQGFPQEPGKLHTGEFIHQDLIL
jgi:hypothetical protein